MKRTLALLAPVCLVAAPPLDPAWMFSPEAKAPSVLPRTLWAGDGTFLFEDLRLPEKERVLERVDPASGKRAPLVDAGRVLARLKELGVKEAPVRLPWPAELDGQGRRALYRIGGAWFVVDLAGAEVTAVGAADAALLSPDGARVALSRDHDLYLRDLAGGAERRITSDGSATVLNGTFSWVYWEEIFDHRDAAFWWSPDSRTLAFLRSDDSQVPLHRFPDFQPWQAKVHEQRYPQPGTPNPAVRLGLVPAGGGAVAWMGGAPFEYLVGVAWTPDGRAAVETLNRAQDALELAAVGPDGIRKPVLTERSPTWVHFYAPRWLGDGSLLLASDRSGYDHLYRFDGAGTLLNAVSRGDWSLWPWGQYAGGRSGLVDVDEKAGWAWFTCQADGSVERQLWKARLDGTGLQRASQGSGSHQVTFSPRHDFYLDAWSSVTRTPSLTLHRADGSVAQVLAEPRPAPDLPRPELRTFRAGDGVALPLWVLKPRDFDPSRRHPVIFEVYGGPGAPSVTDAWSAGGGFSQVLASQGYVVVAADNRSSAGLGMKFEASIKGRLYGETEVKDLEAAVDWVKAQPWADPGRLGVWGWSGGGTYTLAALTRTRAFKAGVAVAPVTDWRFYDSVYTEMSMKRPEDNPEGYQATSEVASAKDLHGRLLLVHGTFDDNVHPQNAQAFADALIAAGLPFEQMVYPMRKHGISDRPAQLHLYRTMLEFWKRNL